MSGMMWAPLFLAASLTSATGTSGHKIIANGALGVVKATRSHLADVFLKQTARWPDGRPARPVDQSATSSVRESFSHDVLGRGTPAVIGYWQGQIQAGRAVPPPVRGSDREVIEYVASTPGAVGYVAAETPTPAAVVPVLVLD